MFKRTVFAALVAAVCLAVAPRAHAFLGLSGGGAANVLSVGGEVTIPVAAVDDGKAHYFTYRAGGKYLDFFVLRGDDGRIRAAFDACDVCSPEGRGFSRQGDYMVCNFCGQRFRSDRINARDGGCNPVPLRLDVADGDVHIAVADLAAGKPYF